MPYACFGKVLYINLSNKTWEVRSLPETVYRHYLGGVGLGAYLLYQEGGAAEPFSEQAPLIFAVGPLNGTKAPGSGSYCVVARSPLTGGFTAGQANGFWGRNLKACGYDAVVIQGRLPGLSTIHLNGNGVEFYDAAHLKGMDCFETEDTVKQFFAEKGVNSRVISIGPAGERMVRYASINNDHGHIAACGGVGAVMGYKNIKAIAASGDIKVSLYDDAVYTEVVNAWREAAINSPAGKKYNDEGTAGDFKGRQILGSLPVKNYTEYQFLGHEKFSASSLRPNYAVKRKGCYGCNLSHLHHYEIKSGKYAGFVGEEVDYECLAGWGANIGNHDPEAAIWLNDYADRMGIDAKEATFTIAMAMECFQRGLITEHDTSGLKLEWGNPESIAEIIRMIAFREGFGNVLAEGVYRAAQRIGPEAVKAGVYFAKGCAPHVHDVRNLWEVMFSQIISNSPSFESTHLYRNVDPDFGIMSQIAHFDGADIAKAVAVMVTRRQISDSLVVCNFPLRGKFDTVIHSLNAATGWGLSFDDMTAIGNRIVTLTRLYNYKLGFSVKNDDISPRMATPPKGGLGKGLSIKAALPTMRRIYYEAMGWDGVSGAPLPQTLEQLAIDVSLP